MEVQGDNRSWWYFTFGYGQKNSGHYVRIFGTYEEARKKMIDRYGLKWAFQYSEPQWKDWEMRCKMSGSEWMLEKELDSGT